MPNCCQGKTNQTCSFATKLNYFCTTQPSAHPISTPSIYTRTYHENQRFVEIEQTDTTLFESDCSEDANLFLAVVDVGGHACGKGEKGHEHDDADQDIEHLVDEHPCFVQFAELFVANVDIF